jgi:rSAM/selenodomain-associated transferase 2
VQNVLEDAAHSLRAHTMRLSVIVPALNEAEAITAAIRSAKAADEVIVVDGGSSDATSDVAAALGATVVQSVRGRGRQLAVGADLASGDVLLFLHADTVLPAGFREQVERVLSTAAWGRFDVRFDKGGLLLRLIAWLISTRSRLSRVATGDQAMFVTRVALQSVGGIREPELFEDIDLSRRLKRRAPMGVPVDPVVTSSRRWREDGVWRTTFLMWTMKSLYLMGVPADRLARHYRHVR